MKYCKCILILLLLVPMIVYGDSYKGNVVIDTDISTSDKRYSSNIGGEASLYVSGGNSTITNSTITKSGNYNKFEYNSGLLISNSAKLKINNSSIITSGTNSPGIVALSRSNLSMDNVSINTTDVDSPLIYSRESSIIVVENSKLKTDKSPGIIIDKHAYIDLNNVDLDINSSTGENIIIYNDYPSGNDMDSNNLKIFNSTIKVNNGYVFSVEDIGFNLEFRDSKIENKDNKIIEIKTTGDKEDNYGSANINLYNSEISGDIYISSLSYGYLNFSNSVFIGSINSSSKGEASLHLSEDSVIVLTEDSYVNELSADKKNFSNIFLNGHTLYNNGEKVRGNKGKYLGKDKDGNVLVDNSEVEKETITISVIVIGFVIIVIVFAILKKRKRKRTIEAF